jgi:serine/threonine protein kinase/tetratricopeptide (TPR) repeat protein
MITNRVTDAAAQWKRAREIFDDLVVLDPAERSDRLADACGTDLELQLEVESLLACDRSSTDTIERLVAEAAFDVESESTLKPAAPLPTVIGRYRIIRKVGEGGMGEVFLAEDASLGRRVALKLPSTHLAGIPRVRLQLQQEARAAATINHPHVCVVHEVGEGGGGRPFIAMEYVEGEMLAERVRRGPMPAREVIELGRQAASALSEAHSKGVVHRDLKPSNIMLTPHGVKILDFGLASVTRDPALAKEETASRVFAGTVPYMSPEQVRLEEVDHRTDLYSLGVVLYEAATGCRPFEAQTSRATCKAILESEPRPPSQVVPSLPLEIDRVISRALAKDRELRYQGAAELFADLSDPGRARSDSSTDTAHRVTTTMPRLRLALAGLAVALAVGITYWLARPSPPSFPAPRRDVVLVADFVNTTNDPAFDGTLAQVLTGQLQQTPFLTLFPDDGVRETLRVMSRSSEDRLTNGVALEICRRRGIKAWIAGSIAPIGRRYAITLDALDGQTGKTLSHERIEADSRVEVLPALGRIAIQLRQTLGEPFQSIQKFNTPVEQATTRSLDALSAYALGVEQAGRGNYPVAVSLYERAIQIDPQFAVAHEALAREQINTGYGQEAASAAVTRAYALRGRATEQEKLSIEALYHSTVTGNLERSIEAGELWKKTFPLEWRPYHLLGDLYNSTAQYERAVEAAREAVRLNPDIAAAYSNLAGSLFALDRFDEARAVYRQAMARGLDAPEYHAYLWRIAYYLGDAEGAQQELDWAAGSSTWAFNMAALSSALQGRWRDALRASEDASEFFEARDLKGFVALAARYDAVAGALFGDCATTRQRATRTLGAFQAPEEQARTIVALAMCGETTRAALFADRLQNRYPRDTMLNRVWFPLIRAAASLERDPARAIDALRLAAPFEGAAESWPVYLRGLAFLRAGRGAEARVEFKSIVSHRGRTLWVPFYPLAHLGLARAETMIGDVAAAERAYRDLFDLWKSADADLPVLVEARREYEGLRSR